MSDTDGATARRGRRGAGREARRARAAGGQSAAAFIERRVPTYEVLDEEGLALIEHNADTLLEEIGIEFRDDAEALALWRDAGADVDGERVRFPRGLCRKLVTDGAPREFVQHARNPERSVRIGGNSLVCVPVYGPPFVRDLDGGRRYATIEDFRNFVKLAYLSPGLHHSGGTVCEPVDLPVNKRHLDMVLAHVQLSDKPFMGSVTAPERAEDTVEMARILFGDGFADPDTGLEKTVVTSLINANSPMVFDGTMLGAAKVYARANQACVISPFILAGAMSPVTVAGTATQILAEALAGMAFVQLVRPGAPVVFGTFASSVSMQTGAPTFGSPEPSLVMYVAGALARRLGVPFRSGGGLSRLEDQPMRRRPTSRPTRSRPPRSRASTSCSTPPAGSRAGSSPATRSSCSTPTRRARCRRCWRASTCPRTARRCRRSGRWAPATTSSARPTPRRTS